MKIILQVIIEIIEREYDLFLFPKLRLKCQKYEDDRG